MTAGKTKIIDLFCGAGGMSLGFTDSRFGGSGEVVLALDNNAAAIETHETNIRGKAICADLVHWLENNEVPQADIVIGGPPCQGFSLLNKNREGDERRALWMPFLETAQRAGARMFVMENVAQLSRSPELALIQAAAAKLGYDTEVKVLLAADYGAPQTRKRTIIMGWTANTQMPAFPPLPSHRSPKIENNLPVWRTVRDAISDLPEPRRTDIKGKPPLDIHIKRNPTEKSLKRYAAVPPGGNRFDLQRNAPEITPACWIRKKSGGTDLFGRLWWDRPSVTIRTEFFKPEKGRYLHPVKDRPITHREAARLMGFPDDFIFKGSKTEIARQIGNAVPPQLAGAISQVVNQALWPMAKAG